jgi:hypothetical protein
MNYTPYQKTDLCKLFEKYKSDKCPAVHHTYSSKYYELLNPVKHQVKNMLEIGIGNIPLMTQIIPDGYIPGASIKAWRDFFQNAIVYAVDILPEVLFEDERIKTYQLDQSSIESIQHFINNIKKETSEDFMFDFIIDDGSHIIDHMIISGYEFPKYLKEGGIYIIEDVQTKYLPALMDVKFPHLQMTHTYQGGTDWDNFLVYKKI